MNVRLIIGKNNSYSTCLGKVNALRRDYVQNNLSYGMDTLDLPPEILRLMEDHINGNATLEAYLLTMTKANRCFLPQYPPQVSCS